MGQLPPSDAAVTLCFRKVTVISYKSQKFTFATEFNNRYQKAKIQECNFVNGLTSWTQTVETFSLSIVLCEICDAVLRKSVIKIRSNQRI